MIIDNLITKKEEILAERDNITLKLIRDVNFDYGVFGLSIGNKQIVLTVNDWECIKYNIDRFLKEKDWKAFVEFK